jgi:hypothetical protein
MKSQRGKYVYGIISRIDGAAYLEPGGKLGYMESDDLNTIQNSIDDIRGLQGSPVHVIQYQDIGAAVSDIGHQQAQMLGSVVKSGQKEGIDSLLIHRQVVEELRNRGLAVLPVKFGSIVTESRARQMLREKQDEYLTKMHRFQNRDEFGVRIVVTQKTAAKITDELVRQTSEPRHNSKGMSLLEKMRRKDSIANRKFMILERVVSAAHVELAKAAESSANLSRETPETIFNRTYLVTRSGRKAFLDNLEKVRHRTKAWGLLTYQSGPWAPYSFCMEPVLSDIAVASPDLGSYSRGSSKRSGKYRLIKSHQGKEFSLA